MAQLIDPAWDVGKVCEFLKDQQMSNDIITKFQKENINGKAFLLLNEIHLEKLGLAMGDRVILLDLIMKSKNQVEFQGLSLDKSAPLVSGTKMTLRDHVATKDRLVEGSHGCQSSPPPESDYSVSNTTESKKQKINLKTLSSILNNTRVGLHFVPSTIDSICAGTACKVVCLKPTEDMTAFEKVCRFLIITKNQEINSTAVWREICKFQELWYSYLPYEMKKMFTYDSKQEEVLCAKSSSQCSLRQDTQVKTSLMCLDAFDPSKMFCLLIMEDCLLLEQETVYTCLHREGENACIQFAVSSASNITIHATLATSPAIELKRFVKEQQSENPDQAEKSEVTTGKKFDKAKTKIEKIICKLNDLKSNVVFSFATMKQLPKEMCSISIIHKKKDETDFEKTCVFLLLCRQAPNPRLVWTEICNVQHHWICYLPDKVKKQFIYDSNCHKVRRVSSDEECGLESGRIVGTVDSLLKSDLGGRCCILIVEESLLKTDRHVYGCILEEDERNCIELSIDSKVTIHAKIKTEPKFQFTYFLPAQPSVLPDLAPQTRTHGVKKPVLDNPRNFDEAVKTKTYTQGHQLNCFETGTIDMIRPVHEFKLLRIQNNEEAMLNYFGRETIRFGCGCMNARTNGTIHFGVADGSEENARRFGHISREIVGVVVINQDKFFDQRTQSVRRSFDNYSTALDCIRPPVFVPVRKIDGMIPNLFVIEVDVEPSAVYCKGLAFAVCEEKNDTIHTTYIREGSSSKKLSTKDSAQFYQRISKVDAEREERELAERKRMLSSGSGYHEKLGKKLQRLLCNDRERLARGRSLLLVLCAPDDESVVDKLQFISSVQWRVVIDFDHTHGFLKDVQGRKNCIHYKENCAEDFEAKELLASVLDTRAWIFANGSDRDGCGPLDYRDWFGSNRNKGLSNLTEFLSSELPPRNTTIIFLLLSKSYQAECSLFKEMCKQFKGPDRLLYVAETKDIADAWEQNLSEILNPNQINMVSVVGMSWPEVNQQMQQTIGGVVRGGLQLPSPNGVSMTVSIHSINQNIILPLGLNQCSELNELNGKERRKESTDTEHSFYGGCEVAWENFWFTDNGYNHVLKRSVHEELIEKTKNLLKMPPTEGRVFTIEIKHEVGAGVTTIGRHILWELSRAEQYLCRCCVIQQICDDTCDELLKLRNCGSPDRSEDTLPVLAFVDKFQGDLFEELRSEVSDRSQSLSYCILPVVVFLKTREYPTLPKESQVDVETTVFVRQKLDQREQRWFEDKLSEMSNTYDGPSEHFQTFVSEHLITFMMMRHNFNPDYVTSVVERSLQNATADEKLLLKYLSILSYGGARPVFERVFDEIMLSPEFRNRALLSDWFTQLTESTRVLLKETDMSEDAGTGHGIAIVHPLIAATILENLTSGQSQLLAESIIEFLGSPLCARETNPASKAFRRAVSTMLVQRPVNDTGEQSNFSCLIEKILFGKLMSNMDKPSCGSNIVQAKAILVKGLEVFKHPRISQQIARLLYFHTDHCLVPGDDEKTQQNLTEWFQEAEIYAVKAVEMSSGKSHHIDTVGRVHKAKFNTCYPQIKWKSLSIITVCQAIEVGLEAIAWFQKCQRKSSEWDKDLGFLGELEMIAQLIDMLLKLPVLDSANGRRQLQIYMSTEEVPEMFCPAWDKYKDRLKEFQKRVYVCLESVKEDTSIFKSTSQIENKKKYKILTSCAQVCQQIFTSETNDKLLENIPIQDKTWAYINGYLVGEYFSNVFNIQTSPRVKNPRNCLCDILKRLESNLRNFPSGRSAESRDFLAMITVHMALHSPYGKPYSQLKDDANEEYMVVATFVDKYTKLEMQREKPTLYPCLFKMMFLWPREDNVLKNGQDYDHWLKELRKYFSARAKVMQHPDQKELHPKYTKEPRSRAATCLFYLGEGHGLDVFVHVNELQRNSNNQVDFTSQNVRDRLRRLWGRRHDCNTIKVNNPVSPGEYLDVVYTDIKKRPFSRQYVSFYLGFSSNGPIAKDVTPEHHLHDTKPQNEQSACVSITTQEDQTVPEELHSSISPEKDQKELRRIKKKLKEIDNLEGQRRLEENQKAKVARKAELLKRKEELERNVLSPPGQEDH